MNMNINLVPHKATSIMNLEARKLSLIKWVSSIEQLEMLEKLEALQRQDSSYWDELNDEDRAKIEEGLKQLDHGEHLTRSEVNEKISGKYKIQWFTDAVPR